MKINVYDKTVNVLRKKIALLKTHNLTDFDILSSYVVTMDEAYSNVKYYFIRLRNGKMGLYLLPGLRFIAGEDIIDKKTFEKISKKEYKNRDELVSQEPSEGLFYRLKGSYTDKQNEKLMYHPYHNGFSYLTSLYYEKCERYKPAYDKLYDRLKRECDNLGINYETNPEKILEEKLKRYVEEDKFKLHDVTICKSKESIDKYYNEKILGAKDFKTLDNELTDFSYFRSTFISAFTGEFLMKSNFLIEALEDRNYPNRESILKNYMEFFIAKDLAFELVNYTKNLLEEGAIYQATKNKERFKNNSKFMEDLEKIIELDEERETYRYHATTSEESANQILEEGFYLYSESLDSTSFKEFDINDILTYAYGNGYTFYGDYIIIISEPKDEEIIHELSEEEQENVTICPRRTALYSTKPKFKVDKKHIVAIVDKEHERVIINPEYQKTIIK